MAGTVTLEIDASELSGEIDRLRSIMKPERFDRVMYGIFSRTGGHVRKILKKDLPPHYYVKAGEIMSAVKSPKLSIGGGGTGCVIPITAPKKSIGGGFSASGGAHGWNSKKRKYKVKARIIKAGQSTLPDIMSTYGGQPPFRNLGSRLGKLTFTRAGASRLPIMKVSGIAVPQMPMNLSKPEVQKDILDYMERRIEHEFQRVIAGR